MAALSRARRAELQRQAQRIRLDCQRSGLTVAETAAAIVADLPQVLPLEAWRLAYGWSRPQCLAGIAQLYQADGLAEPGVDSAMLCKWEHGHSDPGPEYSWVLCRLYGVSPSQLGLRHLFPDRPVLSPIPRGRYLADQTGQLAATRRQAAMAEQTTLGALRESIELAIEAEGPAGGALAREQVAAAVDYYAVNYSRFTPGLLANEVHRTRTVVGRMLTQPQSDDARRELRCLAGWLSALVGNLEFHLSDYPAAGIHFATAARLGTAAGQDHLVCWSLGAQAMTAYTQNRPAEALELSRQALEYADTPLQRAQILAWAQLRSCALLGLRREAGEAAAAAQDAMAADPRGDLPGRFGFDTAELELHLSEAALVLGDYQQARAHAVASMRQISKGRPAWAAASLVLARGEVARGGHSDGAALGLQVLAAVEPQALRETTRVRLRALDLDLAEAGASGGEVMELREQVRSLAPLLPARSSTDPADP